MFLNEPVSSVAKYFKDTETIAVFLTRVCFTFHSLQDWTQEELTSHSTDMHKNVEKEKRIRENILDIRQALAKEVTQKTREVAGQAIN